MHEGSISENKKAIMIVHRRGKKYKVFVNDLSRVIQMTRLAKSIPSFFDLKQ